jgi:hypothetical protein
MSNRCPLEQFSIYDFSNKAMLPCKSCSSGQIEYFYSSALTPPKSREFYKRCQTDIHFSKFKCINSIKVKTYSDPATLRTSYPSTKNGHANFLRLYFH